MKFSDLKLREQTYNGDTKYFFDLPDGGHGYTVDNPGRIFHVNSSDGYSYTDYNANEDIPGTGNGILEHPNGFITTDMNYHSSGYNTGNSGTSAPSNKGVTSGKSIWIYAGLGVVGIIIILLLFK